MTPKQRVYKSLNETSFVSNSIYGLIILNVIAIFLESYSEVRSTYGVYLSIFDTCSVIVFTLEYLLRLWSADAKKESNHRPGARLRFATSAFGIIDLLAILPFYLPMIFPFDLRIVRVMRLIRLLRILEHGHFTKSMKTIQSVLRKTRSELTMAFAISFIFLMLAATLMYYIEHDAQPEKFANIGQALWWSVETLTTVGYGDIYPITTLGKILSGVIAMIGIGFIALPTGIISSAFVKELREQKAGGGKSECICPECGNRFLHRNEKKHA
jgi:voltage-gated potassium channel